MLRLTFSLFHWLLLAVTRGAKCSEAGPFETRWGPAPQLPYGTTPLDSSQLPQLLAQKTSLDHDTRSMETIRNKLSLYAFAIDGKQFDVLEQIFSSDAVANYSAPLGVLSGVAEIIATMEQTQAKVSAGQHSLSSQFVEIVDEHNAFSVSYFVSAQFGKGVYLNEGLYSTGQYQDSWFRQDPKRQEWMISHRNLVYMVSLEM